MQINFKVNFPYTATIEIDDDATDEEVREAIIAAVPRSLTWVVEDDGKPVIQSVIRTD